MKRTIHTIVLPTLPGLLLLLAASACGGATSDGGTTAATEAPASADLTEAQLDKLDEELRDRLAAGDQAEPIPVRVKFLMRPSRAALSELYLVAYERDAIGRVDVGTLKTIAAREDVEHISFVSGTGYDDGE